MEVRIAFNRLFTFNFCYEKKRVIQAVRNEYHVYESTDQMKPQRLELFKAVIEMNERAALEILEGSRKFLINGFREVEDHIYIANTIYPTSPEELSLRRCHQDEALGICFSMLKELEYIMRSMPVRAEKFPRYIEMINVELGYLKAWRSSNNKFNFDEKSSRKKKKSAEVKATNDPSGSAISQENQSTSDSATGNDVPSSKPAYSKGYSYTTGYRHHNR